MRRLGPRFLSLFILVMAGTIAAETRITRAAEFAQPARQAATKLEEVDDDFAFQGEYFGTLARIGGGPGSTVGLQVAAQGSGDYIAIEYYGGLPGNGWYGGENILRLRGRREPDRLTLTGVRRRYEIGDGVAWYVDQNGEQLTWLTKVERKSSSLGQVPPTDAVVLFNGTSTDKFVDGVMTPDGLLKEGTLTQDAYQDYFLHIEFQLPYMPYARGQGRGNSGVYLQRRYEVQILDSFALDGKFNECGALYRYRAPDINMCLPPLVWQTYDIDFRSARFDVSGRKTQNALITLWHNGYPVHEQEEITRKTGGGAPEGPELLPILLQKHGNPVRFRNIWLVVNTKDKRYIPSLPLRVYQHPAGSYGVVRLHNDRG